MPFWNRYDICEAFNLLAHDYGLYDVRTRLDNMGFKCGVSRDLYKNLDENGQAIYDYHADLLDRGVSPIKSDYK